MPDTVLKKIERIRELEQRARDRGMISQSFSWDESASEYPFEVRLDDAIMWMEHSDAHHSLTAEQKMLLNAMSVYEGIREAVGILSFDRLGVVMGTAEEPDYRAMVRRAWSQLDMLSMTAGNYITSEMRAGVAIAKAFHGMLKTEKNPMQHLENYVRFIRTSGERPMRIAEFDAHYAPIGGVLRYDLRRDNMIEEVDGEIRLTKKAERVPNE